MFPTLLVISLLTRDLLACSPFTKDSFAVSPAMLGVSSSSDPNNFATSSVLDNFLFNHRARGLNTHVSMPDDLRSGVPSQPLQELSGTFEASTKSPLDRANINLSLGAPSSPPIEDSHQLDCKDFDESCKWRNVEGMFIDELDWYQGSGELDQIKLQVSTSTDISPEGAYAIVATDSVQLPTSKAVLVSDQVGCQIGDGELRFMYWTSPGVRIKVCSKRLSKPYPDFDFCSAPIEVADPGPAFVNIPDPGTAPFQLFVIAENFVYNADNLRGGFSIIDNLEYYAQMCSRGSGSTTDVREEQGTFTLPEAELSSEATTSKFATLMPDATFQLGVPDSTGLMAWEGAGSLDEAPASDKPFFSPQIKRVGPLDENNVEEANEEISYKSVCDVLVCSFNISDSCSTLALTSGWEVTTSVVGNPLSGIKGDASMLPYNEGGSYAFIAGPQDVARMQTDSFRVDRPVLLVFSYHKADRASDLQVVYKLENQSEVRPFYAPQVTKNSRRWFRDSITLPVGFYEYLAFEVRNLKENAQIGIDEVFVVDDRRKSFCMF